jgi:CRISPR-associated protein Cmr2
MQEAIAPWTQAFCDRRELFNDDENARKHFRQRLEYFLKTLWNMTETENQNTEIQNWLKLAAFTIRNRTITVKVP